MPRYTPLYRPPYFASLPRATWKLIERPAAGLGFDLRQDLPLSEHRFGVVEFDRELTADEVAAFELKEL